MTDDVDDTRRRLLEAADFMAQGRAVYVPDLLMTAARLLGQMARGIAAVEPLIRAAEREECAEAIEAFPMPGNLTHVLGSIIRARTSPAPGDPV